MQERIKKIQTTLRKKGLSGAILTNHFNIYYLSSFKGVSQTEREAILIVTSKKATLITARLYQQEAVMLKSKFLDVKIASERNEINKFIKQELNFRTQTPKIGFEQQDLKVSELLEFRKILKGAKLIPAKHLIEDIRQVKTEDEIKKIEKAQLITQKAFDQITKTLKKGQTEEEIAENLVKIIKSLGGQGLAFETIVASGPNSSKPHYQTGKRQIKKDDILLLDFGAKYQNYCADLTRTIFMGKAKDEHKNIYHHVETAQKKALKKIRKDIRASRVHKHTIKHFEQHGLSDKFLHSLGHGIGLEVHEKPSISTKSKDTLEEGMVFSVEPGLYFPDWGGVRIEDLVAIVNGKSILLGKTAQFIEIT